MSELKIKGKLTNILNPVSGISKSGKEWNKQDFIITTDDRYPKEICFTLFGDKTDLISNVKLNDEIEVSFNLESREYEGRYFHNLNAWKIILTQSEPPKTAPEVLHEVNYENELAAKHNQEYDEATDVSDSEDNDNLPF